MDRRGISTSPQPSSDNTRWTNSWTLATQGFQIVVANIIVVKVAMEPFGVRKSVFYGSIVKLIRDAFGGVSKGVVAAEYAAAAHLDGHQGMGGRAPQFFGCLQSISCGKLPL